MSKFALFFICIFLGGIFAAFVIAPVSAFLVYQFVYFVNPDIRWWAATIPGMRYSFISVAVMMLVLAVNYKKLSAEAPWKEQPIFKWVLAILAMYFIMLNFAISPEVHKRFTIDFAKLVVIMMVAYKLITTEKALHACLWVYILGATYIGYMAYTVGRNWQGRVEGIGMVDTGGDGNMTAAAMAPALVILIYMAWLGSKKIKVLAILCGAFIANGIVLINSRGAFLGVVVGTAFFLFYMIFSKYQKKGQRGMAMLIIVLGLGGALYVTDEAFWERMQTLQQVDDGDVSGSHRIEFWFATFDIMRDYPFGVGIEGYVALSQNYLPERYFERRDIGKAVHSTWFQVLAELGWPGPLLFSCLLIATFRLSLRTKRHLIKRKRYEEYFKMLALEGALISYLVAASFIDRTRAELLYWMIMFIAVAANVYYLRYFYSSSSDSRSSLIKESVKL